MVTFLFWNISRKPLHSLVANLVHGHDVDVLILAECHVPAPTMLNALNQPNRPRFRRVQSQCAKLTVYSRLTEQMITPLHETARTTIMRLALPGRAEVLLAAAHLPSKLHWGAGSQALESARFAERVRAVEARAGHSRTVVVGDLNMNPFELGLVGASALNAVMTREIASRGARTVQGQQYPFFYNPMWGRFGDITDGPPGTYYYASSEHETTFWNIFDQVLIRPALMHAFQSESLQVLQGDGETHFLDERGLPDSSTASDHLPVLFQLDL